MQFRTKVASVKLVANLIVGAGASIIVKTIIKDNVAPAKRTHKVYVAAAAVVLGWMVSEAAGKYTNQQIDACVLAWKKLQEALHPTD